MQGPEAVPPLQAGERPGMRALLGLFGCAAAEGTSLRHGLGALTQQCRGVLECAQHSLAPSMQPLLSVCLATLPQPSHRLAFTLPQVPHSPSLKSHAACPHDELNHFLYSPVELVHGTNSEVGQGCEC